MSVKDLVGLSLKYGVLTLYNDILGTKWRSKIKGANGNSRFQMENNVCITHVYACLSMTDLAVVNLIPLVPIVFCANGQLCFNNLLTANY